MRTIQEILIEQHGIADVISEQFPEHSNRLRLSGQEILDVMDAVSKAMAEADRLRHMAERMADQAEKELDACVNHHELNAGALRHALGHWRDDVPGGFVATVCHHIVSMRRGIKELILNNVITMSRGAEILGLPLRDVRRWANSGLFIPGGDGGEGASQEPAE